MKNKKIKDERIVQTQNKIFAEAYFVTVLLLFLSVFVKAYLVKCDYTNYIGEVGIIVLSTIYIAIRSMTMGNPLFDTSKRNKILCILGALGASIAITVINGIKNYASYGEKYTGVFDLHFFAALAVTFISSLALITVGILFIYLCHKKGQQKIEKMINQDETEGE